MTLLQQTVAIFHVNMRCSNVLGILFVSVVTVFGIEIGSWEGVFYRGITHGHTNERTKSRLLMYSKMV